MQRAQQLYIFPGDNHGLIHVISYAALELPE